eukprot:gene7972-8170_t
MSKDRITHHQPSTYALRIQLIVIAAVFGTGKHALGTFAVLLLSVPLLLQVVKTLQALPTDSIITATELQQQTAHQLKQKLVDAGVSCEGCLEKQELIDKLQQIGGSSASSCSICCEEYATGDVKSSRVLALVVCIVLPEHVILPLVQAAEVTGARQLQNRVQDLELELQAVKQQLALLLGAAAVVPDSRKSNSSGTAFQPFVPQTANTQRTLAHRSSLWPQFFGFLSVVSADAAITTTHIIADRAGSPVYVALGDAAGWLYFFTPQGHLVYEYNTGKQPGQYSGLELGV